MNDNKATVSVHVDVAPATEPGVVVVLLDLLASAGVRATWSLLRDADAALHDRLFFEGHAVVERDVDDVDKDAAGDQHASAIEWLQHVHVAVGDALQHGRHVELVIDTATMARPANVAVVSEALDLVKGLVRAERLRVVAPRAQAARRTFAEDAAVA